MTLKVLVDWNNDNFQSSYADITKDLIYFHTIRGRTIDNLALGLSTPSRAIIRVQNLVGRYSPFSTTSPFAGSIIPGRQIQITYNDIPLWTGFLDKITPKATNPRRLPIVEFRALGPIGFLDKQTVRVPADISKKPGDIVKDALNQAGWPAARRQTAAGRTTIAYWPGHEGRPSEIIALAENIELGFTRETAAGQIIFTDRQYRLRKTKQPVSRHFLDNSDPDHPNAIYFAGVEQKTPLVYLFNQFEYTLISYTIDHDQNFPIYSILATDFAPILLRANETRTFSGVFEPNDTFLGVFTWNNPQITASHDNYTFTPTLKGANIFEFTITNNSTSPLAISSILFTGRMLRKGNQLLRQKIEPTPEIKQQFGVREYPVKPNFYYERENLDPRNADSWLRWIDRFYNSTASAISLSWYAKFQSDSDIQELTTRELTDVVAVSSSTRTGLNLPSNQENFFVERIELRWKRHSKKIDVKYELLPASAYSGFFILDISRLGSGDRLILV